MLFVPHLENNNNFDRTMTSGLLACSNMGPMPEILENSGFILT
jgi:hypothetical protein